jgi:hypothetical protein
MVEMPYKNLTFTEKRISRIYYGMRQRCEYPKHKNFDRYGGRGIKVCEEWKTGWRDFYKWAISNGYADNLTLDRIDNDGDYCPENCRWVTRTQQANNTSRNVLITYNGKTQNLSEWVKELGIRRSLIKYRMSCGMSFEDAIKTPSLRDKCRRIKE